MRRRAWLLLILIFATMTGSAWTEDFDTLCSDRAAVERVYYKHRLGNKPPFEKTMPPGLIEKLVHEDLHKAAVLKKVYGVEITPAMLEAEVQRINLSTRAPDVLAELKAALDNDAGRFARTVAKPIVVERILHDKFDNDAALHAPERQWCESVRNELLAAKRNGAQPDKLVALFMRLGSNEVTRTTWQLGKPPEERAHGEKELIEAQRRFGPEAQILSPHPRTESGPKFYFQNLPPQLQQVLQAQLRQADDISAVIETPVDFRLYLCEDITATTLSMDTLAISKRSYEQWLLQQD